jgi:hypothetical protein
MAKNMTISIEQAWENLDERNRGQKEPTGEGLVGEPIEPAAKGDRKVIAPLHGIRTIAAWQRTLSDAAQSYHDLGWLCPLEKWNYGRFSLFRFLMPRQRRIKVSWFRQTYTEFMRDRSIPTSETNLPSIVAHSFGAYILGNCLLKYENIRFDKVILCGSILPIGFPWDVILDRGQVSAVRNEYGSNDIWSKLVHWVVSGTGASGQRGFERNHPLLIQEEFRFDHKEYFDRGHMERYWLPFIEQTAVRQYRQLPLHRGRNNVPWLLYGSYVVIMVVLLWLWMPNQAVEYISTHIKIPIISQLEDDVALLKWEVKQQSQTIQTSAQKANLDTLNPNKIALISGPYPSDTWVRSYIHEVDGGVMIADETPDSLIGRLRVSPPLAKLHRPDLTPVWVKASAVTSIRPPLPSEEVGDHLVNAVLVLGSFHQGVTEDVGTARTIINAHGGDIISQ